MYTTLDDTLKTKEKALNWLFQVPCTTQNESRENFFREPIAISQSPNEAVDYLIKCATHEKQMHVLDHEMRGVTLTIGFEYGTMLPKQLELTFTFSGMDDKGSISFSVSTIKTENGAFHTFGDEEFRGL